jgi:hypothetical protein
LASNVGGHITALFAGESKKKMPHVGGFSFLPLQNVNAGLHYQ